jgi:hypothetical protein
MARRKPVPYRRAARFSKEWWLQLLRDLFWIVLVTILIWIYADMEFTDEVRVNATLVLSTENAPRLTLVSPAEYDITFSLSGSRTSLEQFRRDLAARGSLLEYDVTGYTIGKTVAPTDVLLSEAAGLRERGIAVEMTDPPGIPIKLDRLEQIKNVPVYLQTTGATLVAPPEPGKVDLLVPTGRWTEIQARLAGQSPRLETTQVDLSPLPPGQPKDIRAEIIPEIAGLPVHPVRDQVTFTVEIVNPEVQREMQVVVQVLAPSGWVGPDDPTWEQYVLVKNPAFDWRPKIKVIGAQKDMKSENITAYIELTDEDKKPVESWLERDVTIHFARDTTLKLLGAPPKVQFRLEKLAGVPAAVP